MVFSVFRADYLPPEAREHLLNYEYHGEDRSYIYKLLWRPLCRWLAGRLPVWLAPNVITVTALAFVGFTHGLLVYYMPKLTVKNNDYLPRNETSASTATIPFAKEFLPPPPVFVFVLAAFALFMYQLLDNLDGHQARRTGTSSPLGLLMDHGCDAFNCVLGALSVASAISAGPCWKTWFIVLNTLIVFFMNTWEEYYRGVLVLPVVNGPNEGILIAILVYLWTAWKGGPHWWYNNGVVVPERWLPEVLRLPAPEAAVAIEKGVLSAVCPWLHRLGGNGDDVDGFSPIPFFFNLNCSAAYMAHPPVPTEVLFDTDPRLAKREQIVMGKLWNGRSVIQRAVLRAYGTDEHSLRLRYNTIAVLIMTVLAFFTCAGNVYQVWRAIQRMSSEERRRHSTNDAHWLQRKYFFLLDACARLLPLFMLTMMANAWFFTSQEDIFRRHPRIFSWTVGLLYTKLVIHLMVSHLCGCAFNPLRRTFVPFALFGAHITMTYFHNLNKLRKKRQGPSTAIWGAPSDTGGENGVASGDYVVSANSVIAGMLMATSSAYSDYAYDVDEELILYEFFALSVITFLHLVWNVVRQMAAVLNVPVFTVPKEKQKALLMQMAKEKKMKTH